MLLIRAQVKVVSDQFFCNKSCLVIRYPPTGDGHTSTAWTHIRHLIYVLGIPSQLKKPQIRRLGF